MTKKFNHPDHIYSNHYPCDECTHINLLNHIEHLGLAWDINNLQGKILIENLERKANEILQLVKIEKELLK